MHVILEKEAVVIEYLPAPQATQSVSASLPSLSRYLPGSHDKHVSFDQAPNCSEYFPAPHDTHTDGDVAPFFAEYFPRSQLVHAPFPVTDLYLPEEQLTHILLNHVKPGLHMHDGCAPGLSVLTGHTSQPALPSTSLNVPTGHGVQEGKRPV